MSTYFLMVPNYWASGPSSTKAWANVRFHSGKPKSRLRKGTYFMLEFAEDNLEFKVDTVTGAWRVDAYPVRVVEHNKIAAEHLKQFADWCKEGLARWAKKQEG